MKKLIVGLAGNPNVGKTTVFNQLTGMRQHVGNWPGKTVERAEGHFTHGNYEYDVVDLPGNYALSAHSMEEIVSRDFIVDDDSDVIVNVVDAANLERNLYLTVQMMELGANLVLALNMNDFAKKKDHIIDIDLMSELLGFSVVEINAKNKDGFDVLLSAVEKAASKPKNTSAKLSYGDELKEHLGDLQELIERDNKLLDVPSIWTAIKLLEKDSIVIQKVQQSSISSQIMAETDKVAGHLHTIYKEGAEEVVANARYAFIDGLMAEAVKRPAVEKETITDKIDKIVTNRILAPFIFIILMWAMFQLTFTVGAPFQDMIDQAFGMLSEWVATFLGDGLLSSFVCDGIIGGVGGVLTFLPIIILMFLFLSILEDCGYLARAAFTLDKIMHKIVGLHGKAFIPMILGFGCGVPAIMATRTMENEGDRMLAMMLVPFMSCTARLPIYAIFVAAFFADNGGNVLLAIYLLGIVVALIVAAILKRTMFKGLSTPFVMELPTYKVPSLKGVLLHTWEKVKGFLRKAGTIILACSIVLWILQNIFPYGGSDPQMSLLGMIGTAIAPIFAPLGFGTWQAAVAIIAGLAAKEVVVATFGTLAGMEEDDEEGITNLIHDTFTPLSAFSFMAFTLLYTPCFAAIGAIKQETNSYKWALTMCAITLVTAFIVSFLIYNIGLLAGFG
ncbi:ferrous iron transport protein B [Methanobrevibacter gottschalkii]|uniref:Ferrous iron transport protein B n=2 Tax=Methanobrevibacter gottschalkii TaxID=190974 RepID=A0A3N5B752_9EURY|nr:MULTISPECIES: ferrous iron transport protein B [Methanobrevibacter]MCQ2970318.1 ferrous iron transport protein B [archaeon]OEC95390.1 ferrous iron transport protein B [Methanobrevibacter sp. A27]RPF53127.1 ferrous iron transport protein B [Methanobrevibacter gottschalkii DSM 11977]SEK61794.1 ferrous iron transport protein B [Methanobrevibacter gottschalkii]